MLRNRNLGSLPFYSLNVRICCAWLCNQYGGGTAFIIFLALRRDFNVYKIRYNRIALLSSQIDLVLHNAGRLDLGEMDEGELSILHSEITK